MRSLLCITLLAFACTANAQSITSFGPDTTAKHAARDTVDRPMWFGLQASPFAGGSRQPGFPDAWDPGGMPWVGLNMAWPSATPAETWLALGYEHWSFSLKPDSFPFAPVFLSFVSPQVLDLVTVRTGVDGLMFRDYIVSGAFGVGGGTGYGKASIGTTGEVAANVVPLELLAHAFLYVRAGNAVRIGLGGSGGETWVWSDGAIGDPFVHWEFAFRFDRQVSGPAHHAPAPAPAP